MNTIAVLPIQPFLDQPSQEYFVDGMTELLISELGRLDAARIVSLASALHYKGSESSYPEIGQGLGADFLIDASLLKTEETLRLRVEFHEAPSNRMLWRRSYEKEPADVYAILTDIVEEVAASVHVVSPPPKSARKVDPPSFDTFLLGLHHWSRSNEADYKQAIQCYIDSLKGDPDFGPAYSMLAAGYAYLGFWGHLPLQQVYPRARLAAEKALELDPNAVEAHSALALVHWLFDWDLSAAESAFSRALKLNPSHATVHWARGLFLGAVKERFDEALAEMNQVSAIDPRSPMPNTGCGWILYYGRQFEKASEHFTKTLEANEEIVSSWHGRGLSNMERKEYDDALIAFNRALAIAADPYSQGLLGMATGRKGDATEARRILDELLELSTKERIPSLAIAWIYLGLDERQDCLEWLEKAVEERDPQIFWLKTAALYDPLRGDSGLNELLKKIGFGN